MSSSTPLGHVPLATPADAPVPRHRLQHRLAGLYFALALAALAVAVGLALPHATVVALMQEYGSVETATLWLYMGAIVALLLGGVGVLPLADLAAGALLLAAMAAREAELHTETFGISILKLRFYLDAPWQHVAIALAILLPVAASAAWLLLRHCRRWPLAPLRWTPPMVTLAAMLAAMVFAKVMDRTPNTLSSLGLPVLPLGVLAVMQSLEEVLELGLPLFPVLALLQARLRRAPSPRM